MDADTANSQRDRWVIIFDDAERGPMHFSGEGAEEAAHRTFKRMLMAWSCRLFKTIEINPALAGD